ncbi:MAG: EF-P beta-lysylation protein EpmB, partial [Planctomycetaceae bacterium]|nr:EF-P beta-lysylation protein EpmB [Planctomycetaceae bacterium]
LRVHSRLPIVLPSRVTEGVIDLLTRSRLTPFLVVHANHPNELLGDCGEGLRRLVRGGITVLNQAVLLRGINDDVETQVALSERLIDLGIIPYYLHQLDRVAGTAHFEVARERGVEIIAEMRKRLPGYGVPQYVEEIAGEESKSPVGI